MLNEYKATLKNGQITWLDTPPNSNDVYDITVIVNEPLAEQLSKPRRIGMLAGKAKFPDDINKYDDEVARLFGVEL